MNVVDKKQALRRKMKTLLGALPDEHRKSAGRMVGRHLASWLAEVLPKTASKVALFSSLNDEICTEDLDELLKSLGAKRAIAVSNSADELCFLPLNNETNACSISWNDKARADSAQASHSTVNPSAFDIIFVPGLAFDRQGHRLGRGQAYFDRSLARLSTGTGGETILVGLAMDEQVVSEIPHAEHDVTINYVCTPKLGLLRVA